MMLRTENGIIQDYQTTHAIAMKIYHGTRTIQLLGESNNFDRKVREALEIQYHNTKQKGMNIDNGQYVSTKFWMPMLSFLKNEKKKRKVSH